MKFKMPHRSSIAGRLHYFNRQTGQEVEAYQYLKPGDHPDMLDYWTAKDLKTTDVCWKCQIPLFLHGALPGFKNPVCPTTWIINHPGITELLPNDMFERGFIPRAE